jgi:uncharacterized repeat protein (TIGR01451 family)
MIKSSFKLLVVLVVLAGASSAVQAQSGPALTTTLSGRNITRAQSGEYRSVSGRGGDTLEIFARVRNVSDTPVFDIFLIDILPSGLRYVAPSTALNGRIIADGVTSSGINIGSLWPGQEAVVRFSVVVDGAAMPSWGQVDLANVLQVRADGVNTISGRLPITLGSNASLAAVSRVKTGPVDSVLLALLISIVVTGLYALYTDTLLFQRRFTLARLRQLSSRPLNFSR